MPSSMEDYMAKRIIIPVLAASACAMAATGSASATPVFAPYAQEAPAPGADSVWQHGRHREWRGNHRHGTQRTYYDEPVYRDTRVWRGRDGRYHCRRKDGTVGLIVGGAVGALLGRQIDGGYDRSTGTILGGAAGALLGRSIARGNTRCR